MSEGLTPVEVSKELKDFVLEFVKNGLDRRFVIGSFNILEKALKDYEYWSSFVKWYGDVKAEDLQRIIHNGWVYDQTGYKKDKAFDIIKEKLVDIDLFSYCANKSMYNNRVNVGKQLTDEEYDLLKEVLL